MDSAAGPTRLTARGWFERLCDLDAAEGERELAALAARDPEMAREVGALLAADAAAPETFLATAATPTALLEAVSSGSGSAGAPAAGPAPGDRVGPYRLEERLGRGGMGEVWRARRADGQFEQEVALKLVRGDLDSGEIVRRFLAERQILARLDHPNIARLLDGGVAGDGRPYFALELVEGETITCFADAHRLGVEERIRLVVEAGMAVAAAHARLVVHRDLKPSNILVGGDGRVRLLDFGIAKLLDAAEDGAPATRTTVLPLTPAYAAPEQIRGEPASTATDVYALGAVLFELLTGQRPFARRAMTAEGLAAEVRDETLPRASRSVLAAAGGARRARELAGDLDLVLARALHADPAQRYATCEALVEDLTRFLELRPVLARPDSVGYRIGRFARRNRLAVAAGIALVATLAGGLAVALGQRTAALAAADLARREAERARTEAVRAARVEEFLLSIFDEADPVRRKSAGPATVEDLVQAALVRLPKDLSGEPAVEASIFADLSKVLGNLNRKEEALAAAERSVALFRRALRPGDPAIVAGLDALQAARWNLGHPLGAERAAREALALLVAAGQSDSDRADEVRSGLMVNAAELGHPAEALAMERELAASIARRKGSEAPGLVNLGISEGALLLELGRAAEAEASLRRTLELAVRAGGPDHLTVAYVRMNLADALSRQQRGAEADAELVSALAILEQRLGRGTSMWTEACRQRAAVLRTLGRVAQAAALDCPPVRE